MASIRILCVIGFVCAASFAGAAESKAKALPHGYTCEDVRGYVARWGETVALAWAKLKGFTDEQIERARRCVK